MARSGSMPGRVVRGVDDDQPGRRRHLAAQQIQVERPAGVLAELVERDVGARRPRDLVQALVAGPGHDRVVTRTQEHVEQAEDRLLGAGERQDLVRLDRVVERRDLAAEQRVAGGLGVAEAQVRPEGPGLVVGQRQQVGHRVALHVRRAQEPAGLELPAGEVALELEVGESARAPSRSVADGDQGRPERPDGRLIEAIAGEQPADGRTRIDDDGELALGRLRSACRRGRRRRSCRSRSRRGRNRSRRCTRRLPGA